MALLALIRISTGEILLSCLHAFKCDDENVEIEVLFRVRIVMENISKLLIELLLINGL